MLNNSGLPASSHHTQPGCSPTRPSIRQTASANTVVRVSVVPANRKANTIGPILQPRPYRFLRVVPLPPFHPGGSQDQHHPSHMNAPRGSFADSPASIKSLLSKRAAGEGLPSYLNCPTLPHYRMANFIVIRSLCGWLWTSHYP
jgi:hypothetical protein